ncbi:MAG: hypothetical protein GKR90_22410 [Pseudomonadales bacterium]|nr:hypothetical protein [Pseudomonadales bacterium]
MKRFDAKALYQALNEQRLQREVTWSQISKEIGVSASTIQRTKLGGRMEVDGMIAMVGWLDVPVETFVRETDF